MCQSKAATGGIGKRCFVHHPGTQASINYVYSKTGIDKKQIYDIMKELRKEGRMLDAPSPEEVEKYFALEEFKTKFDNTLTEKERVTILKQLLAARSEAKTNPVSGGVLHSWKNAMQRTVQRFKRPLIALGLTGTLLFGAAGCVGNVSPDPVATPSISASQGTTTNPSNPSAEVPCSTDNPGPYGDAVQKAEVTDQYGTYCHITIDPDSAALTFDASKVDSTVAELGFTNEDAAAAQKAAVTFVVEQSLDSALLDTYTKENSVKWLEDNKNLINPSSIELYENYANESGLSKGVVVTGEGFPVLRRDGSPRSNTVAIQVEKIYAKELDGKPYIQVATNVSTTYPAKNSDIVKFALTQSDKGITEQSLREMSPFLFDNPDGESSMAINGIFSVAYYKDNYKQFAGTTTDWNLGVVENG